MRGPSAKLIFQLGLSGAAALFIIAGASLNVSGRAGQTALIATGGALLAVLAGAIYREWKFALPLVAGAVGFALLAAHFNLHNAELPLNLAGLLFLLLGGFVGAIAFDSFHREVRDRLEELEAVNRQLDEKHRAFLAATADAVTTPQVGDIGATTVSIAQQVGAGMACYYLASPDGKQFVPQPPGVGLEQVRPHSVTRRPEGADPLLAAMETGGDFVGEDARALVSLFDYLPEGLAVEGVLASSMRVGEHIGGFILLANKPGGFTEDDRRLANTLTLRAGSQLATAHAVALSKKELARYSLLNELVKEASGKTMDEVLNLILDKGRELVKYDSARVAVFAPDNTFLMMGGSEVPTPIDGPLLKVKNGETVIRTLITADEGLYSGLKPVSEGGTVNEALTAIRGKDGVIGAICLGRSGPTGFAQRDVAALEELGTMAGVAVENSRILQQVSGQASKLDTALDALGEVSQALTTVTEGALVLEQKTIQTAVRVTGATHALLTRTGGDVQKVIVALNFPAAANGLEFRNGQGMIGAVMLSGRPIALSDLSTNPELAAPPDLAALGIQAAVCVPMVGEGQLWGTLSVYDVKRREWTANDQRVLTTLGSQGVVAVKNAELYEKSQSMIWELSNLQTGLRAVTSTLDLNTVLEQLLHGAAKAASAQIGCIALDEDGKLKLYAAYGTDHATAEKLALGLGGDICRDVMATGQPFLEHVDRGTDADTPLNPRAVLCVPIALRGKPTGVVFLANYKVGVHFSQDHRNVVTELAAQAAIPIDNSRIVLAALEALANAVDARDPYTAGHSKRVTAYAETIARQMNYAVDDAAARRRLHQGGLLHDIGKIKVPDAVLSKPGKLTDVEFDQMKAHPVAGFEILKPLNMLTDELVIVRSHHERYDGKGYPDGKKGDELPMYAWMVSAADAIDAMTSDRPYRKGMPLEVAVEQVREGAGTHFHPDVAEAVLDAARTGALKVIPQESMYKDAPVIGAFENPTG